MVKPQFYRLCEDFYTGKLDLHSINTAYITLIPKTQDSETVSDYRPISLVSLALKFITKILANRLQNVIIPLIHRNQYGFIRSRTIHDCLAWEFEYLHLCHKSTKEIIIIKIDFEKAFDKVEYSAILLMLKNLDLVINGLDGLTVSSTQLQHLFYSMVSPGKLLIVKEESGKVICYLHCSL